MTGAAGGERADGRVDEVTDRGSTPPEAAVLGLWLWDLLFATAAVVTCLLIAWEDRPVGARIAAAVVVVVLTAGWPAAGRRMALAGRPRATVPDIAYCVAQGVGLLVGVSLADSANWAAFIVYSQLFWLLPAAGAIIGVVTLTVLVPLAGAVFRDKGVVGDLFPPQALFMTVFGILVGTYIHRVLRESAVRAELIADLETSQAQVAELSHVAGAAGERERLAGEIHDTLAQGFTSIITLLQAAEAQFDGDPAAARRHLDLAVRTARENLGEARRLVAAATPGDLADHSLSEAVGRQVARFAEESGVETGHATTGTPRKLPTESEIVLLRAAQELLANVRRHAGAGSTAVELDYTAPGAVVLTVTDDGTGFDPDAVGDASFGLRMMRARVERMDGTVGVASGPDGTTVTVTLPTAIPTTVTPPTVTPPTVIPTTAGTHEEAR